MGKESIKAVAKEVLTKVRKGELPKVGKIMVKHGYSKQYSKHPNRITTKRAFLEELEPVIAIMEKERARLLESMGKTDLRKVQYHRKAIVMDILIKNGELLSGRPTNRNDLTFYDDEQAKTIADRIIRRKQTA